MHDPSHLLGLDWRAKHPKSLSVNLTTQTRKLSDLRDRHQRVMSTVDGENRLSVTEEAEAERKTETQRQARRGTEAKGSRPPNAERSCSAVNSGVVWSQGSRDWKWNESLFTCNHLVYLLGRIFTLHQRYRPPTHSRPIGHLPSPPSSQSTLLFPPPTAKRSQKPSQSRPTALPVCPFSSP